MTGPDSSARRQGPPLITGSAKVAGVVGSPIRHSLSPQLHGAWIRALDLDAVYAPFTTTAEHFPQLLEGLRGGVVLGLNVTLPFKSLALSIADRAEACARRAGAANLLLFHKDGEIEARNTDGLGLLYALQRQTPGWCADSGPITILGAGGAARGAVVALKDAGATDIRILNRTLSRAEDLANDLGCRAFHLDRAAAAFDGAMTVINTTSAQLDGADDLPRPPKAARGAVAMDMVYKPLQTPFLLQCADAGYRCVDGLDMLIGQAIPSFEAFFGKPPPKRVDARGILLTLQREKERG
jgi:shikimate dehydrogenase